jgi:hypothetical protein
MVHSHWHRGSRSCGANRTPHFEGASAGHEIGCHRHSPRRLWLQPPGHHNENQHHCRPPHTARRRRCPWSHRQDAIRHRGIATTTSIYRGGGLPPPPTPFDEATEGKEGSWGCTRDSLEGRERKGRECTNYDYDSFNTKTWVIGQWF